MFTENTNRIRTEGEAFGEGSESRTDSNSHTESPSLSFDGGAVPRGTRKKFPTPNRQHKGNGVLSFSMSPISSTITILIETSYHSPAKVPLACPAFDLFAQASLLGGVPAAVRSLGT
jgi:hypothetical protein